MTPTQWSRTFAAQPQAICPRIALSAYKPQASVSLWEKMTAQNGKGGPAFLSTHPSGPNRIRELQSNVPKVQALYEAARKG